MSDTFSTTSSSGFFSRIKGAIVGALLGLVLVPGSVVLLSWNEYRTIHRTRGLNEGAETVQTIDPANANPEFKEALVHMTGLADTQERLKDNEFGIEERAIHLKRDVEMFQWVEEKETKSKDKVGGGKTTTETYSYHKQWASGRKDSERFNRPSGHYNPTPKFDDVSVSAKKVNVGAYALDSSLKNSIRSYEDVSWTDAIVESLPEEIFNTCAVDGDYLYWAESQTPDAQSPEVGDLRIKVRVVKPTVVSLVAGVDQSGTSLGDFEVSNGESMRKLYVGEFSAVEVFEKMRSENSMWAWIFRGLGFFLSFIGFCMILGIFGAFASVIPFFGSLTRSLTGFVSFLLAIVTTAMTIAVAWIAVRPLIAIPLIIASVLAAVMIWRTSKKSSAKTVPSFAAPAETPVTLTADDVV
jgi:hypothetical protein